MDELNNSLILEYSVSEEDYLTNLLYTASQSKRIQRNRGRNKAIVPVVYLIFGLCALYFGAIGLTMFFLSASAIWYFVYPVYDKRHYLKYYKKILAEKPKEFFNKIAIVQLNSDFIFIKDTEGNESKIVAKNITGIVEISNLILLQTKSGNIIIPKGKLVHLVAVVEWLKAFAAKLNVSYTVNYSWRGK